MTEREPREHPRVSKKKPYQKPQVSDQGNIRELTQGGSSLGGDVMGRKPPTGPMA